MFSRSLFRSKNRCDSPSKTHSSRSSSVTSAGDSGIDDDLNRSGRSDWPVGMFDMKNFQYQYTGKIIPIIPVFRFLPRAKLRGAILIGARKEGRRQV